VDARALRPSERGGDLRCGGRLCASRLCTAGDGGHVLDCAQRYQFKLFKPLAEVVVDDLPFAWLKDALAVQEGAGWDCC